LIYDLRENIGGLKDFFSEVDKLHKTDEAVTAKIANNPALAKELELELELELDLDLDLELFWSMSAI
jgi:hypothetical protein